MKKPSNETKPEAQGNYLTAKRFGNLVAVAGMTPRRDGLLVLEGPVRTERPIAEYGEAVQQACRNSLAAARGVLTQDEGIAGLLQLTVFIACEPSFRRHSALADFASTFFSDQLGYNGIGARAAVGVL